MRALPGELRRLIPVRELLIFLAFLLLTIVMTWPWVTHLRDAASDNGDPYLISWNLWWDYHQTFSDPLRLFHANIFYPYRYSLAFSEHNYGTAVFCFPLFALGLRPLTVHGIATLFGFAFSGYGAFRLARSLTGSSGVAWVSGIAFGFVPYRFGQLPHLMYLSSGWIPILLESLVLFVRRRTWPSAIWLGAAFLMNALSSIHWFVLTLMPLAFTAILLLHRQGGWSDRRLWWRGISALTIASVALIPFLLPYARVADLYGFTRSQQEAQFYSAKLVDWFVGDFRNKMWHGLNASARAAERELFPGLLPLLLMLAAIFLVKPRGDESLAHQRSASQKLLTFLDVVIINCAILFVTISGYGFFKLRVFGVYLFEVHRPSAVVALGLLALIVRLLIAYPVIFTRSQGTSLSASLRSDRRSDAFWIAIVWTVTGFAGSLGMNFFFHQALYDYVPLFRSIRVPARWAMICYLGLAILAGLGARQLAQLLARHWRAISPLAIYSIVAIALLVEQRAAPLSLIRGEVDPDPLTVRLRQTPMAGGIVELPSGEGLDQNYLYVLRAADHGQPLVTAVSGFTPAIQREIQSLTQASPIPESFLDLLESIPCSYLVVHNRFLEPARRLDLESVIGTGIAAGRLQYVRSYGERDDLYAVIKTEPQAMMEAQLPFTIGPHASPTAKATGSEESSSTLNDAEIFTRAQYQDVLGREPDAEGLKYWTAQIQQCTSTACRQERRVNLAAAFFMEKEFQATGVFIHAFYERVLGRRPRYAEFVADRAKLAGLSDLEAGKSSLIASWVKSPEFTRLYPSELNSVKLVDALLKTAKTGSGTNLIDKRQRFLDQLSGINGKEVVVRTIIEDSLSRAGYNRLFVLIEYFAYLKRDPDPEGYAFWVDQLNNNGPDAYRSMVRAFITSKEYQSRFVQR